MLLCQLPVSFNYVSYLLVNNKVNKNIRISLDIFEFQVYITPYVLDGLEDICNCLGLRYIFGFQIHIVHHVLSRLRNICNSLGLKNILYLMFLID